MSVNKAELLPENILTNTILDNQRSVEDMKTTQLVGSDSVKLNVTPNLDYSVSVAAGGGFLIVYTLTGASNQRVFAEPLEFTLYQGSIAPANELSSTSNYFNWDARYWRSLFYSDGNNIVDIIAVKNLTGGALTICSRGVWRYIVSNATGTVT